MKKLAQFFHRLKLNQKLSFVVFSLAFIPFAALVVVLFINMQNVVIDERIAETQRDLVQVQTRCEKTAELCAMTSQFFLSSAKLNDFLGRASSFESFAPEELFAFYHEDVIGSFEKLVNSNPYLYQVRVYYSNTNIPEFFPILYHSTRMERLTWSKSNWTSGSWQYDYTDTLFPPEVVSPVTHLMSLVTEISGNHNERIGIMEVAVRMDEMFPDLFTVNENRIEAFATSLEFFSQPDREIFWDIHKDEVLAKIVDKPTDSGLVVEASLGGRAAIISSIAIKQFNGNYIIVMFRDDITTELSARRNIFIIIAVLSMLILAFIVSLLTKTMLQRFYKVISTIHSVRDGSLSAEVPYVGDDEIGLLGSHVNQMLDRVRILMDENVKREIEAKHFAIRALQNQINAHFIYNVLETIKMMAEVDSRYDLSDAITSLGKLLRYSMRKTTDNVTLEEEIEHLENYILLLNLRFDYRIGLHKAIPAHIYQCKIPKLTLQPIVENAVTHGIEDIAEDTVIDLVAEEFGDFYTITITDYGKGISPLDLDAIRNSLSGEFVANANNGIGLRNVNERIKEAFGFDYGISIISDIGSFTSVTIRLPACN